jgi:hypothetical protein
LVLPGSSNVIGTTVSQNNGSEEAASRELGLAVNSLACNLAPVTDEMNDDQALTSKYFVSDSIVAFPQFVETLQMSFQRLGIDTIKGFPQASAAALPREFLQLCLTVPIRDWRASIVESYTLLLGKSQPIRNLVQIFTPLAIGDSFLLLKEAVLNVSPYLECFLRVSKNLFQLLFDNGPNNLFEFIRAHLPHICSHPASFHFTTTFTSRCGTTITLTTSRP